MSIPAAPADWMLPTPPTTIGAPLAAAAVVADPAAVVADPAAVVAVDDDFLLLEHAEANKMSEAVTAIRASRLDRRHRISPFNMRPPTVLGVSPKLHPR
jgi:hypothetical protein